jgi:hypothetical protein
MSFLTTSIPSLVSDGFLTDDHYFVGAAARDLNGCPLAEHQLLRLYGGVILREIAETLVELRNEGLMLNEALASNIAASMELQWKEHDRFPGDCERPPQPYIEGIIPLVVRGAMVREYLPYRTLSDMRDLIDRYEGKHLRRQLEASCTTIDEDTFARLLRTEQKQPVVVRNCQNPSCKQLVKTTLEQAVAAIRHFHLLPEVGQPFAGKFFNPHAKCMTCNRDRSWMKPVRGKFSNKEASTVAAPSNLGTIADLIAGQRAHAAEKPPKNAAAKKPAAKKATKKAKTATPPASVPELMTVKLDEERS